MVRLPIEPPVQIEASGVVSLADSSNSYATRYGKSDGSAWAVGSNNFGQLGDGTLVDRNQSVQIASVGVQAIFEWNCIWIHSFKYWGIEGF